MAKPLGLTTRGKSQQVRIVVPKDLKEAYGGRVDFRIALKSSGMEAKAEAHRLRTQKDTEFAERRRMLFSAGAQVTAVTPELGKAIALGVYAEAMAQDDGARKDVGVQRALLEVAALARPVGGLQIGDDPIAPSELDGLPEEAATTLAGLNAITEADDPDARAARRARARSTSKTALCRVTTIGSRTRSGRSPSGGRTGCSRAACARASALRRS